MPSFALDTNALIKISDSSELTKAVINYIKWPSGNEVVINIRTTEEFYKKLTNQQEENFHALEQALTLDTQQYFTIGVSTIGGPDRLAGQLYTAMNVDYSEEKYKDHLKNAKNPKSKEDFVRKLQSDAVILSLAQDKGCKYLVTDDTKLKKKASEAGSILEVISLEKFSSIIQGGL